MGGKDLPTRDPGHPPMPLPVLHIGNKNYSSLSLRPWLLMQVLGIAFEEHLIPLFDENWDSAIARVSPSRKVPCLTDGDVTVWETMAIVEYLHEHHPGAGESFDVWSLIEVAARIRAVFDHFH